MKTSTNYAILSKILSSTSNDGAESQHHTPKNSIFPRCYTYQSHRNMDKNLVITLSKKYLKMYQKHSELSVLRPMGFVVLDNKRLWPLVGDRKT